MMYSWTVAFPNEDKMNEAYQTLRRQGLVSSDPQLTADKTLIPSPPSRPKNPVFDNEDMGKDDARVQKMTKRMHTLEEVNNNVKLLSEMLSHYHQDRSSDADRDLIKGLTMRQIRFRFDGQPINETDTPAQNPFRLVDSEEFLLILITLLLHYTMMSQISGGEASGVLCGEHSAPLRRCHQPPIYLNNSEHPGKLTVPAMKKNISKLCDEISCIGGFKLLIRPPGEHKLPPHLNEIVLGHGMSLVQQFCVSGVRLVLRKKFNGAALANPQNTTKLEEKEETNPLNDHTSNTPDKNDDAVMIQIDLTTLQTEEARNTPQNDQTSKTKQEVSHDISNMKSIRFFHQWINKVEEEGRGKEGSGGGIGSEGGSGGGSEGGSGGGSEGGSGGGDVVMGVKRLYAPRQRLACNIKDETEKGQSERWRTECLSFPSSSLSFRLKLRIRNINLLRALVSLLKGCGVFL
ncbi:ADP-ribosylation factor-binding protein GGA3 [Bagarius yarrelli]|uniref:ADP-ribosylation factor-binding protein GGA3 n=1 Tax=Bagarius yarrelli TaxID=175774 RepID=A0A556V7B0_BAGYA|nr:ADP-ribosylation factor-binding protein GGA3 [Bagarius yarrelli]